MVIHILFAVPGQQWQVQNQRDPVAVDEEKERQDGVDSGFGDDVRVEAVAKIDGVDIVTGANLASRVVLGGRLRRRGREGARARQRLGKGRDEMRTIPNRCTLS
jgi:hypothetical protein